MNPLYNNSCSVSHFYQRIEFQCRMKNVSCCDTRKNCFVYITYELAYHVSFSEFTNTPLCSHCKCIEKVLPANSGHLRRTTSQC